ncbi:DUF4169 family protein [Aestuariivirga litoralis]|uniref:DUF4169 family protein n=1 Tax=Aestuariivirga litoralis TaxID=2650924 RepID=UPI001AEDBEB5|nr:DUF4169 family protein [Aestuariivirga litoralis]
MGEVVNLRLKRKAKNREEAADKAAENRVQFGRSKTEKELTSALNDKAGKSLDDHKRED